MEKNEIRCTSKEHEKINANTYCKECNIYMCKKCENFHSILFQNHLIYNTNEDIKQIFTGICNEDHHSNKLIYFCKTHNVLCCAACITKIKDNENGQHKDCQVCKIERIKKEKLNKLKDNIKNLEDLSVSLQDSINEIKNIFSKININKEALKLSVQKIFTKIRNQLNEREDEILLNINEKFNKLFFKEELVKECDKLPNKIKMSLEKGKTLINNNNENNNKLNSLINDCINIEKNIKYINDLNECMKKCRAMNVNVKFIPEENDINNFLENIKNFGKIIFNNYKFKKCPEKISQNRKYIISEDEENIITKTGTNCEWMGTICENQLDKLKEYIWKIKVLETDNYEIMIGVANSDFDIMTSLYSNCGWYYYWRNNSLYSGPPHNYNNKYIKINKPYNDSDKDKDFDEKRRKCKKIKKKRYDSSEEDSEKEICKKKRKKKMIVQI